MLRKESCGSKDQFGVEKDTLCFQKELDSTVARLPEKLQCSTEHYKPSLLAFLSYQSQVLALTFNCRLAAERTTDNEVRH